MKTKGEYLDRIDSVPGWFHPEDRRLFVALNEIQRECAISGHVLEIGAYQGKSAILLGYELKSAERLVVCDLFGMPPETAEERTENERYYRDLGRGAFESNYLRFHTALPHILQCSSTRLDLEPRSFRFIHIDGSHQYDIVRTDVETAVRLLADDGVIAIDDYRSFHTPGVALGVWTSIAAGLVEPICVTPWKLYAIAGGRPDRIGWISRLKRWVKDETDMQVESESVLGLEFLRFFAVDRPVGIFRRMYWAARAGSGQPA